jgi:4-alpha-glucanotransferase
VTYTGTHDNDTARGWYETAPDHERDFARRYLDTDGNNFAWELTRAGWASVAVYAVAPIQDLLGLGTEARMNYPSKLGGNWSWRLLSEQLSQELQERVRELNYLYRR